jgi:hypothetical protein
LNDLELLREMFKDTRLHIGIGTIDKLGLSTDAATLRVLVNLLPENREVVATMTFSDVNDVTFPEVGDLAIVNFADGDPEECHVMKLVNSKDELIPQFARTGHSVKYSRTGKKMYIGSDTKLGLGRPNVEPTEPLVLGNVLKTYLTALEGQVEALIGVIDTIPATITTAPGNIGLVNPAFKTAVDAVKTQLAADKSTYLTTSGTNIVSQIGFTERGV